MRRPIFAALVAALGLVLGVAASAADAPKPSEVKGRVTAVDAKMMTVTVEAKDGKNETFKLGDKADIMRAGDTKMMTLAEVKPGEEVRIHYMTSGANMMASKIVILPQHEQHPAAYTPEKPKSK